MSEAFQGYIDQSLIGSGNMHSACIAGMDGNYWAYGGDYVPQPDELKDIIKCLDSPDLAREKGVHIATQKYFVLRAEPGLMYVKLGAGGACIGKSDTAVVIGVYGEGVAPPACNMTVEGIIKYLKDNGY